MTQFQRLFRATARAAFAAMLLGWVSGEARAEPARSWILESQSGQVHLARPGITPIALSTGDVFADGDWIETGPDGRAILRRGEETIVIAPGSRIGLPKNNNGPYATRILQTLGTILLTVEKKAAQHFEVETPYLTAVVKGTTFTVGIQNGRSVVHVVEGLVEVKNLSSGRSSLVRPGQTGSVIRGGSTDVEIGGGGNDTGAAPAGSAAIEAQGADHAVAQTDGRASPAAAVAGSDGGSGNVRIIQALGPTALDLSQSTKGLVRAARLSQGNGPGKGRTTGKKADVGSSSQAEGKSPKVGKNDGAAGSQKGGGKGRNLGKSGGAASGPKSAGKGQSLGKSSGAAGGLKASGSGSDLAKSGGVGGLGGAGKQGSALAGVAGISAASNSASANSLGLGKSVSAVVSDFGVPNRTSGKKLGKGLEKVKSHAPPGKTK